jgi:putative hydrolase
MAIDNRPGMIDLAHDLHVHSHFSDGDDGIPENLAAAESAGVTRLGCVDHVRRDTMWVAEYVGAVREAQRSTAVVLTAGLEAKILDRQGALDLPADYRDADVIYAADHQFPWHDGPRSPREVRAWLAAGALAPADAVDCLVEATIAAMHRYRGERLVLAHLFSILPKLGLAEEIVPLESIGALGVVAVGTSTVVELSERWRCPSVRAARALRNAGVQLVSSTDSHQAATIGRYAYVAEVAAALDGTG